MCSFLLCYTGVISGGPCLGGGNGVRSNFKILIKT